MAETFLKFETVTEPKQKTAKHAQSQTMLRRLRSLLPILTLVGIAAAWQIIVMLEIYPRFIIPAPAEVLESFLEVLRDGTLLHHIRVTGSEMLLGLLYGVTLATFLGYAIAKNRLLGEMLSPVIVAFQATPVVAYAPLLIIWFGSGMTSKVITSAVIVFFPTLMNTVVGIRSVPTNLRELFRSLNATPVQTFTKLEIPAALPVLLTGLKTSATLAVIGAVVGEFINASEGLGFLVMRARSQFDTPLVFVAVFTMTALALSLYLGVAALERITLRWQK